MGAEAARARGIGMEGEGCGVDVRVLTGGRGRCESEWRGLVGLVRC